MSQDSKRRSARTAFYLAIAVLANSFGNLLLAMAVNSMPAFTEVGLWQYLSSVVHNPFLIPGVALSATYALVQVWLFSWADLSFVVPCIASSYVVSTLLAEFILGEQIEVTRWLGVLLICCGVVLVARTPVATKPHPGTACK